MAYGDDVHFVNSNDQNFSTIQRRAICGVGVFDLPISAYYAGDGWEHVNWEHVTCMGCILVRLAALVEEARYSRLFFFFLIIFR